ncbi:MAG: flagellar biosynthetic protein FliO [Deltaproteobacteria bacterium]|nr:flagellar biosynthetic protein FliO [Deltaproteobacteria bacterium]
MKTRLLSILLLLTPVPALAAGLGNEPSLLSSALKMVAALGVIIGLLLLFYAASRKGFGFLPKQRDGAIKILETKALGGKKFLCLVSVRGEDLLLGLSNERIECLSKLSSGTDFPETLQKQLEEDAS